MRVLAWNIRGGSRRGISHVVRAAAPDVAVLSDCRPSRYVGLAAELMDSGFDWVVGTNQADVTGLLIASKTPIQPGSTSSKVLPGHWCHVWLPAMRVSIVGIYGPLRGKGVANLVPAFWEELLQTAKQLTTGTAVVVGDLNTAIAPCDTTSGLPLPAAKDLYQPTMAGEMPFAKYTVIDPPTATGTTGVLTALITLCCRLRLGPCEVPTT
jgi:exonuclease III